jgi:hypothetical protein
MTETDLRKRLVQVIARRSRSGKAGGVSTVAHQAYDDLAVVLVPLVSRTGFEALVGRAFHLAQREFPAARAGGDAQESDPFAPIGVWLDRQEERSAIDAAAAVFAALAGLLITLIGDSLTTRYLQKAWPEGFSPRHGKGKRS